MLKQPKGTKIRASLCMNQQLTLVSCLSMQDGSLERFLNCLLDIDFVNFYTSNFRSENYFQVIQTVNPIAVITEQFYTEIVHRKITAAETTKSEINYPCI
jgi:hypothetical protein